jgi:glutathione synthase/RimK-type ligase-like ATP-grasp enzyme
MTTSPLLRPDALPAPQLRILLTGGRAPVALDLARLFRGAGHTVFMAESRDPILSHASRAIERHFQVPPPNRDVDAYGRALGAIARDHSIDLLIPTCEELFHVSRARDHLPASCRVPVEPIDRLGALHNKWTFNQDARGIGLPVPDTRLVHTAAEAIAAARAYGACVIKPAYSRFAVSVLFADGGRRDAARIAKLPFDGARPWLVQRRVVGTEYCSWSFAVNGVVKAHCVYDHAFTAGAGAGICFQAIEQPAIERWVHDFVRARSFTGQIAFDFIIASDGQPYALECNPRSTSGIHLFQQDDGLDVAFADPDAVTRPVAPPPGRLAMISAAAMCVYGLPTLTSLSRAREWVRIVRTARDALNDPMNERPLRRQLQAMYSLWKDARRDGTSILEASTADIEWNGEA